MKYVVQVTSPGGEISTKEYDAQSAQNLVLVLKHDLTTRPAAQIVAAWEKDRPDIPVFDVRR
jgi:hypothetical protein